jgi:nitrite reductase/ring-hydroxylating ferredoxin subunit
MNYEELDRQLEQIQRRLAADSVDISAIAEARQRLARRAEERAVASVVCQRCLKQGASVKLTLLEDGETLSCPVHGAQ